MNRGTVEEIPGVHIAELFVDLASKDALMPKTLERHAEAS